MFAAIGLGLIYEKDNEWGEVSSPVESPTASQ
jgi:hypothetical protein